MLHAEGWKGTQRSHPKNKKVGQRLKIAQRNEQELRAAAEDAGKTAGRLSRRSSQMPTASQEEKEQE